jgi:hypothetical protein
MKRFFAIEHCAHADSSQRYAMNGGFAVMNRAPGRPIGLRGLRWSARQVALLCDGR